MSLLWKIEINIVYFVTLRLHTKAGWSINLIDKPLKIYGYNSYFLNILPIWIFMVYLFEYLYLSISKVCNFLAV